MLCYAAPSVTVQEPSLGGGSLKMNDQGKLRGRKLQLNHMAQEGWTPTTVGNPGQR